MNKNNISPITFHTACVIDDYKIYVSGSLDHLTKIDDEIEYSRLCIYDFQEENSGWYYHDLDFEVVSVVLDVNYGKTLKALGIDGQIETFDGFSQILDHIDGAGLKETWSSSELGYLFKIKQLNNVLYVSGYSGQFYKYEEDWQPLHIHIDEMDDISILDFELSHLGQLVAVGRNDEQSLLSYYHQDQWKYLDLARYSINTILYSIINISTTEMLICGANGVLFKLKEDYSIEIFLTNLNLDFYSICYFNSQVYLASEQGMYLFDNVRLIKLNIDERIDHRLIFKIEARDDVLWAFTEKYIIRFDRITWFVILHPDNV